MYALTVSEERDLHALAYVNEYYKHLHMKRQQQLKVVQRKKSTEHTHYANNKTSCEANKKFSTERYGRREQGEC